MATLSGMGVRSDYILSTDLLVFEEERRNVLGEGCRHLLDCHLVSADRECLVDELVPVVEQILHHSAYVSHGDGIE